MMISAFSAPMTAKLFLPSPSYSEIRVIYVKASAPLQALVQQIPSHVWLIIHATVPCQPVSASCCRFQLEFYLWKWLKVSLNFHPKPTTPSFSSSISYHAPRRVCTCARRRDKQITQTASRLSAAATFQFVFKCRRVRKKKLWQIECR